MSYDHVSAGKDLPNDINVIIEIPLNGDPIKYEVDKDSGEIFVDRIIRISASHSSSSIDSSNKIYSILMKGRVFRNEISRCDHIVF